MPTLGLIAQLAVIVYMFVTGVELDPALVRGRARSVAAVSQASIAIPMLLGLGLGIYLAPTFAVPGVRTSTFVLFVGTAMSVTAFPVLARILADRRMETTRLGVMALTCAAGSDLTAWTVLALVIGQARHDTRGFVVLELTVAFIAVMYLVVRPMMAALARHLERRDVAWKIVVAFGAMALAATATELIGVHAIVGAFLMGVLIPHDSSLAAAVGTRTRFAVLLLVPVFFAVAGFRTDIGLLSPRDWGICAAIIAVAVAGKLGGTAAAARAAGLPWREAVGLGVLMNTRGLMELIVLNVGLDLGILSPRLFTMFVVMALVTTASTGPLLRLSRTHP